MGLHSNYLALCIQPHEGIEAAWATFALTADRLISWLAERLPQIEDDILKNERLDIVNGRARTVC